MKAMLKVCRKSLLALSIAIAAMGASAAEYDSSANPKAQYARWHDSAVAFAEAMGSISERYAGLRSADKSEALRLIAQSEQAATRQDFDMASQNARQAYELLRASITAAVRYSGSVGTDKAIQRSSALGR